MGQGWGGLGETRAGDLIRLSCDGLGLSSYKLSPQPKQDQLLLLLKTLPNTYCSIAPSGEKLERKIINNR